MLTDSLSTEYDLDENIYNDLEYAENELANAIIREVKEKAEYEMKNDAEEESRYLEEAALGGEKKIIKWFES